MTQITVVDPLKVDITCFSQPTELRDRGGTVLGVFTPAAPGVPSKLPFTREELDEAAAEPGGRTLEEIWRSIGAK